MDHVIVRHKVKDFSKWKTHFENYEKERKEHGSKGGKIFRNADDAQEVVILFHTDDLDKMKELLHSKKLQERMKDAGVMNSPDEYFLKEVEEFRA